MIFNRVYRSANFRFLYFIYFSLSLIFAISLFDIEKLGKIGIGIHSIEPFERLLVFSRTHIGLLTLVVAPTAILLITELYRIYYYHQAESKKIYLRQLIPARYYVFDITVVQEGGTLVWRWQTNVDDNSNKKVEMQIFRRMQTNDIPVENVIIDSRNYHSFRHAMLDASYFARIRVVLKNRVGPWHMSYSLTYKNNSRS